jgi:hypothetical protein
MFGRSRCVSPDYLGLSHVIHRLIEHFYWRWGWTGLLIEDRLHVLVLVRKEGCLPLNHTVSTVALMHQIRNGLLPQSLFCTILASE